MTAARRDVWLAVGLMLVAVVLRAPLLLNTFLDHDEIFTIWISLAPNLDEARWRIFLEGSPPLLHLVLGAWARLFQGDSMVMQRLVALAASLLTLPLAYTLGRRLQSPALGLTGMALLAVNPFLLAFAPLVRHYALVVCLTALSLVALTGALRGARWGWVSVAVVNVALVYTHYYGVWLVAAEGLYLLVAARRDRQWRAFLARGLAACGVPALALAPWLVYALPRQSAILSNIWDKIERWPNPLQVLANAWVAFTVGIAVDGRIGAILAALVAVALLIALVVGRPPLPSLLVVVTLGTLALGALVVLRAPYYSSRYFAVALVPGLMLVAAIVAGQRGAARWGLLALLVGVAVYGDARLIRAAREYPFVDQERLRLYTFLAERVAPGDSLLLTAPWHLSELHALAPGLGRRARLVSDGDAVGAAEAAGRPIWFVGMLDERPEWAAAFDGLAARAPIDVEQSFADSATRAVVYRLTPLPVQPAWQALDTAFQDGLALAAAAMPAEARAGQPLLVGLRWRAEARPTRDATLFVQALDASGALVAGSDAPLAPPTMTWPPGSEQTVWRAVSLPPDLAAGRYTLVAGLYPTGSGGEPRLLIRDGRDAVVLGTVEVDRPAWTAEARPEPSPAPPSNVHWDHDWTFDNRLPAW